MDHLKLEDYMIADIKQEDIVNITELERTISNKSDTDIVLIAYQAKGATAQ